MSVDLTQLLQDQTRVDALPLEVIPSVLANVEWLRAALWVRMMGASGNGQPEAPRQDRLAQTAVAPDSRAGREPMPHARSSLLSVKEAAKMLSCSEAAVRKWVYRRWLPAIKVGRLTRLRVTDVEALIARGARPARADRP